ncbi:TPA: hypothetical protein DDZ86_04315 [Candidatus Dependentiae bacterium]|nr:hypothetical protein [Candidatus Dependentiae bacterium]
MFGYSEYGEYGKEFVVGWGTLAFLNAAIAQLQGRDSGALWFFLSLFMGPFATFLLWITYEKNGVA